MRAFLFFPIALVAAVFAGHLEQRSPFHAISSSLVARTDVIDQGVIPDECKSACSGSITDLNGCTTAQCLCTKDNAQQLKRCVDCLVDMGNSDASTSSGQTTLDSFVSGCKSSGFAINNMTVGGSNSNSNSLASNGDGDAGAGLHLVANGGTLAAALISAVAYLF